MKSLVKLVSFSFLLAVFMVPVAFAVCPVCTVAVGAGLEGARLLGVDDVITGIWAGGLTLSLFFWTAGWLKKRGVKSVWWQIIVPFVFYYALLGLVYALPGVYFGVNTLWGIDKFLLGTIVGTVAFYLGRVGTSKSNVKTAGTQSLPFKRSLFRYLSCWLQRLYSG